MNKSILLAAAVTLTASGFVAAADAVDFQTLDADVNGLISLDEAANSAALTDAFAELDVDQDGSLTEEEFSAFVMTQ